MTDFTRGLDKIVLVGTATLELIASGRSTRLEFGGTEVLLEGVNASSLSDADFIFLESLG